MKKTGWFLFVLTAIFFLAVSPNVNAQYGRPGFSVTIGVGNGYYGGGYYPGYAAGYGYNQWSNGYWTGEYYEGIPAYGAFVLYQNVWIQRMEYMRMRQMQMMRYQRGGYGRGYTNGYTGRGNYGRRR
jgi:hypothetical protein